MSRKRPILVAAALSVTLIVGCTLWFLYPRKPIVLRSIIFLAVPRRDPVHLQIEYAVVCVIQGTGGRTTYVLQEERYSLQDAMAELDKDLASPSPQFVEWLEKEARLSLAPPRSGLVRPARRPPPR